MHPTDDDTGASMEMPRYQSHKKVWALKIAKVEGARLSFAEPGNAPLIVDPKMFARYTPKPGDYYVQHDDGYKSISPAKAFEEGYTRVQTGRELGEEFRKAARALSDPTEERKAKIE